MKSSPVFLVVEDNDEVVEAMRLTLSVRWPDARVITAPTGAEAEELAKSERPDLIMLDLGLPDISGYEVLKRIRSFSRVPVIIVTVRGDETDIVRGLELGANDYIIKPFRQMELLSRVNNQIRGEAPTLEALPVTLGELRVLPSSHEAYLGDRNIKLTPIESSLLATLMRNAGQVVTQITLATEAWGEYYPEAAHSLKVHVRRLREKLETNPSQPGLIFTRPGVGYYMNKPEQSIK
jgi:two-component system KDP operon response regulator KdpE